MSPHRLRRIAASVRAGEVIAYPTEAVFGLGCNPYDLNAVARILALKQRSADKGLILIAADFVQLKPFLLPLSDSQWQQIQQSWPGSVTWLLPVRSQVPKLLRGTHATLAVRVTAHPVAKALCRACDLPLVSTSANPSGRQPARTALAIRQQWGKRVKIVAERVGSAQRPSEIRRLDGTVVRKG